jgi:hypothetical protein
MQWTLMYVGTALSTLVFYYSIILNVCNFNAAEIFILKPKGCGRWESCVGLFYCEYSKVCSMPGGTFQSGGQEELLFMTIQIDNSKRHQS